MSSILQNEETIIDQEIVAELIELTPEWWNSFEMVVKYCIEDGVEKYSHVISSLEGKNDIVVPSEKIFDATYRLGLLFKRYGKQWKYVKYNVTLVSGGDWKYIVDFEY